MGILKESMKDKSQMKPAAIGFAASIGVELVLASAWRKFALNKYGNEKNVPIVPAVGTLVAITAAGLVTWVVVASAMYDKEEKYFDSLMEDANKREGDSIQDAINKAKGDSLQDTINKAKGDSLQDTINKAKVWIEEPWLSTLETIKKEDGERYLKYLIDTGAVGKL